MPHNGYPASSKPTWPAAAVLCTVALLCCCFPPTVASRFATADTHDNNRMRLLALQSCVVPGASSLRNCNDPTCSCTGTSASGSSCSCTGECDSSYRQCDGNRDIQASCNCGQSGQSNVKTISIDEPARQAPAVSQAAPVTGLAIPFLGGVLPAAVPSVGGITTARRAATPLAGVPLIPAPQAAAAPAVARAAPTVATSSLGGGGGGLFSNLLGLGGLSNNGAMATRAAPQIGTAYYQNCACGPCGYSNPSGRVTGGPPARPWCYFEDQRASSDCPGAIQGSAGWWLRTC